jgi:hypothetical protein
MIADSSLSRVSLLVTGSPQFETQDDFGAGDGISTISQWQYQISTHERNSNFLDLDALKVDPTLGNIVNRLRAVFGGVSSTCQESVILTTTDLHDLTCFALHRLLSLSHFAGVDFQSSSTSECLRYSVAAYMFIIHGATYYSHVHILNAFIIQLQCHVGPLLSSLDSNQSLLLWFLSVGAVAATESNESNWFRGKAAAVSAALGVQCWEDVERHLKRVLWLETRSKLVFQLVWDEILSSNSSLQNWATAEKHGQSDTPPTLANTVA